MIPNPASPAKRPRPVNRQKTDRNHPLLRFESICAGCETTHFTPLPRLPNGWAVEIIRGEPQAFCPDCAKGTVQ